MIQLICGPKGTGKTKIILERLNQTAETAKGDIVFITDKRVSTVGVNFKVRCICTEEFGVNEVNQFTGFIKGLLAGNADIEYLYIDGICRIIGKENDTLDAFIAVIESLQKEYGFKAVLTISAEKSELSEKLTGYIA